MKVVGLIKPDMKNKYIERLSLFYRTFSKNRVFVSLMSWFICMSLLELKGMRRKLEFQNEKVFFPQWDLNPRHLYIVLGSHLKYVYTKKKPRYAFCPRLANACSNFFYISSKIIIKLIWSHSLFSLELVYFQCCYFTLNHNFSRYLHW